MQQYRVFVKDALDLAGMPIANVVCTGFTIRKDLLSVKTSDFTLLTIPGNIKEGDVLGLVDPYGTILYNGVISSVSDTVQCNEMLSIFNDDWKWHDPSSTTIEGKIKSIITTDFINSTDPLIKSKFPYTIKTTSSTKGTFEQHMDSYSEQEEYTDEDGKTKKKRVTYEVVSQKYVQSLEDLLIELYDTWGVVTDIQVPFNGTPTITIGQVKADSVKVGNNVNPVFSMLPTTEVVETNKLMIYNKDGSELRATYYGTRNGITVNPQNPTRLPVINTKFVFKDAEEPDEDTGEVVDNIPEIVEQYLQEEMLNHKVDFTLYLNNKLYDFYSWTLGQPMELWYNSNYFNTVFTAYELTLTTGSDLESVSITCGKVRNTLTEIFNRTMSGVSIW